MVPKTYPKAPKRVPKWPKWDPKPVQEGQKGAGWPCPVPETDLSVIKGSLFHERPHLFWSQNWPKFDKKTLQKNNGVFDIVLEAPFLDFVSPNGTKMEPKGYRKRYKNAFGSQKRVFAAVHKNKWFQKEKWGSGPPFWSPQRSRIYAKTEIDCDSGILSTFYRFWVGFGSPKPTPEAHFWGPFSTPKKEC